MLEQKAPVMSRGFLFFCPHNGPRLGFRLQHGINRKKLAKFDNLCWSTAIDKQCLVGLQLSGAAPVDLWLRN